MYGVIKCICDGGFSYCFFCFGDFAKWLNFPFLCFCLSKHLQLADKCDIIKKYIYPKGGGGDVRRFVFLFHPSVSRKGAG